MQLLNELLDSTGGKIAFYNIEEYYPIWVRGNVSSISVLLAVIWRERTVIQGSRWQFQIKEMLGWKIIVVSQLADKKVKLFNKL